jgi:hypothetical protein
MNTVSASQPGLSRLDVARGTVAPALALVFLAPMIAEVLSGATRLSYIFVLIPEMMVWGCGALLIREVVRRWNAGGTSLLLLGLALSVAEEFIIQQTSLAPLPWLGSTPVYSRQWGVNWLFFLFMLGYESVWVVVVPVQLTELIFPERRNDLWLKTRGMVISAAIFLLGSYIAWFAWTQRARPMTFHVPPYHPSPVLIGIGALAIVVLAIAAYALRNAEPKSSARKAPPAWIVGPVVLIMGFPWYALMTLIFAPTLKHNFSFWLPMAVGVVWAFLVYLIVRYWSSSSGWKDMQRWSAVFAATLVCMIAGFSGSSSWLRMDLIAKVILNLIAVVALLLLAIKIRRRGAVIAA